MPDVLAASREAVQLVDVHSHKASDIMCCITIRLGDHGLSPSRMHAAENRDQDSGSSGWKGRKRGIPAAA